MNVACNVVGCLYVAESTIEECGNFPVCPLHDAPQTRKMLDQLQRPGAFWTPQGRPIVVPVGELGEDDLAHRPALVIYRTENENGLWSHADEDGALRAENDPMLANVPDGRGLTHPDFCLTEST